MLKEYILGVGGDFWITRQDTELEIGQSRRGNSKWGNFSPSRPQVSKALYFDMGRQMPKEFIKGRKLASCSPGQDGPGLANGLKGSYRIAGFYLLISTTRLEPPYLVFHENGPSLSPTAIPSVNHILRDGGEVGNRVFIKEATVESITHSPHHDHRKMPRCSVQHPQCQDSKFH